MTEESLFWAYRNLLGYSAECACGDAIVSQFGTEAAVAEAIRVHQKSPRSSTVVRMARSRS